MASKMAPEGPMSLWPCMWGKLCWLKFTFEEFAPVSSQAFSFVFLIFKIVFFPFCYTLLLVWANNGSEEMELQGGSWQFMEPVVFKEWQVAAACGPHSQEKEQYNWHSESGIWHVSGSCCVLAFVLFWFIGKKKPKKRSCEINVNTPRLNHPHPMSTLLPAEDLA